MNSSILYRTVLENVLLVEEQKILIRWPEYCSELYNHENCADRVLDCNQSQEEDLQPILRAEDKIAVTALEREKPVGAYKMPLMFNKDLYQDLENRRMAYYGLSR